MAVTASAMSEISLSLGRAWPWMAGLSMRRAGGESVAASRNGLRGLLESLTKRIGTSRAR